MRVLRGFFGFSGLMFIAGVGVAAEFFIGGDKHLTIGKRSTLAELAEPSTAHAQVTEPAMAAETNAADAVAVADARQDSANAVPPTKPALDGDELASLRAEKRNLQLQQDYLLEQVVKYKRQMLALQNGAEARPSPAAVGDGDRKDPVAIELQKERIRSRGLEQQLEDLKQRGETAKHSREEFASLQARVTEAEADAKRLEGELEAQRATSSDNSFMRKQLGTEKARITELEKQVDSGIHSSQRVNELEKEIEGLNERIRKDDADFKKVADFAVGLKKELQEQKTIVAARDAEAAQLRGEIEKVNVRVTELMQQEAELSRLQGSEGALTQQLADERKHRTEVEQGLNDTREALQQAQAERDALKSEVSQREQSSSVAQEELDETKRQLSKVIEEARSCQQGLEDKEQQVARLPELEKTLSEAKDELGKKQEQIASLSGKTRDQEEMLSKLPDLRRELVAAKNQLLMNQQEMQLLSKKGGSAAPPAAAVSSQRGALANDLVDRHMEASGRRAGVETIRGKKTDPVADAMIVEIIVPRAALRSGPSPDDSEVMSLGQGSKLTVEERKGDWYRVIAPNSVRAYVRADLVRPVTGDPAAGAAALESPAPAPARQDTASHAPRKRPLKVGGSTSNNDMVPFGDVKGPPGTSAQDSIDRAFEKLRSGVGSKPVTPEVVPNQADPTE